MKSSNEFKKLQELALDAAIAAGRYIQSMRGSSINIRTKNNDATIASQVVTDIDIQAEKIILTFLRPSMKENSIGLLTEESEDDQSRFHHDYFWCIDPLDGTLPFSQNQDGYGVSIALVSRSGESIIGVVYLPNSEDLFWSILNQGTFHNGKKIRVCNSNDYLTVIYDKPYEENRQVNHHSEFVNKHVKNLRLEKVIFKRGGGAVANAVSTLLESPAIYYKIPKNNKGGGCIWDFAASALIINEAGGICSDFYGNKLKFNNKNVYFNNNGVCFTSYK